MATPSTLSPRLQLARAVRERFVAEMGRAMSELSVQVQVRLTELVDEPCNARESQVRRDVWMAYKRVRPLWLENTLKAWRTCLEPTKDAKPKNSLEAAVLSW